MTPFGEIVAEPWRGTLMGNRGVLHDADGQIVRFSGERRWISCRLEFRGRRRALMTPGHYTELFFLDEAAALAAGHRPCWECRRADAIAFRAAWTAAAGLPPDTPFPELDRRLHDERLEAPGVMRRWIARVGDLPDGAMVAEGATALLVEGGRVREWMPAGYGPPGPAPAGEVTLLTPPSIVAAIRGGYGLRQGAFV